MVITNQQEYEYGLKNEHLLKPVFDKFFGKEFKETKQYDTYDFVGDEITIELKSRKTCYNKYPTTIVGMNKIDKIKEGEKVFFFFKFIDGLYYWKYTDNDYDIINIQRRDRPLTKPKPHLSIPIKDLIKLEY